MDDEPPLLSCPLWQSVAKLEPQLVELFESSVKHSNRFAGAFRECVELPIRGFRLARKGEAYNEEEENAVMSPGAATALSFPAGGLRFLHRYLAATPLKVKPCLCEGEPCQMTAGALLALTDILTSFHVWVVNFPQPAQHVSIGLQCNVCRPLIPGQPYVAISCIDRLGNRIVYISMEILEADWPAHAPPPASLDSLPKLRAALKCCTVVMNAKHTKSIIPSNGLKPITAPLKETEPVPEK